MRPVLHGPRLVLRRVGRRVLRGRHRRADQDPTRQVDELRAAGCEKVWTDHGVSGTKTSRPELDAMIGYARAGDTIVVTELSRLGRTMRGLSELSSSDDGGGWNDAFVDLANADDSALRDVGKGFVDAPLSDVSEDKPYQKRALAVCGNGGFKAKPAGH